MGFFFGTEEVTIKVFRTLFFHNLKKIILPENGSIKMFARHLEQEMACVRACVCIKRESGCMCLVCECVCVCVH